MAEAAAPERSRANALQKEVKHLQELLKERDSASQAVQLDDAAAAALRVAALEAEVETLRRARAEADERLAEERRQRQKDAAKVEEERLKCEADRRAWCEERDGWEKQRAVLQTGNSRLEWLGQELDKRTEELRASRQAEKVVRTDLAAMTLERDQLLQRLEVEQAEMMARVAQLEERGAKPRR